MGAVTMSDPLDPVRIAFEKAEGPYRKRQKLMVDLKEADVGKDRLEQEIVKGRWVLGRLLKLGITIDKVTQQL
jgi:hypothetical protein